MLKKLDIHEVLPGLIKEACPVIVEVGAHFGIDSRKIREAYPEASLFCFEPDPRSQMVLKKYCADFEFKLIPCAVSNVTSNSAEFYQSYSGKNVEHMLEKYSWIDKDDFIGYRLNRAGASSLKKGHEAVERANVIRVQTIRLDTWAASEGVNRIDLLWVDVQGAEKEVFEGAGRLLESVRYIWVEYGETAYDGGMSRGETIRLLKRYFRVVNRGSIFHRKGELLLKNRYIK